MDLKDLHELEIIEPVKDGTFQITKFGMDIYSFIHNDLTKDNAERDRILYAIENAKSDIADYVYDLQSAYYESPTLKEKIKFKLEDLEKLNLDLEKLEWPNL